MIRRLVKNSKHLVNLDEFKVLGTDRPIGLSKLDQDLASAAVGGGFKDGDKQDDAIDNARTSVPISDLKPAQTKIVPPMVLQMALDMLLSGEIGGYLGIITSSDKYIMDGHHRWAATYLIDPSEKVEVDIVDLPGEQLVTALNVITKGRLGIKTGNPGSGDIRSLNSHTFEPLIDRWLEHGKSSPYSLTPEQVKQALGKIPGASNYTQGKEILLKNADAIPKTIMKNAPDRIDMPVVDKDKVDIATTSLAKGEVDLVEPHSKAVSVKLSEQLDSILEDWCYKLPKGYPTIVDGVFTERGEVEILNEILLDNHFTAIIPTSEAADIKLADISTDGTNIKEAMVMLFYDCIRADPSFVQTYTKIQQQPSRVEIANLKRALKMSKGFNSDYGEVDINNLHEFIVQVLSEPSKSKDYQLINNGFSAAYTIATDPKITTYTKGKAFATRGVVFNKIRSNAVDFFKKIKVNLNFPDNWCPGDFYLMKSSTPPPADNIIELNSNFAGPSYPKGSIVAISLKMEKAQAGKATTFISTVLSVSDVDKNKTKPTNDASRAGTKYLEARRMIGKYAIGKEEIAPDMVNKKLGGSFKFIYDHTKDKNQTPNIKKYAQFGSSKEERAKQYAFIVKNYRKMGTEAGLVIPAIDKVLLGTKTTKAYSDGFEQAYNQFKAYIKKIGIKNIQSAGAGEFIARIKKGKGSVKEGGPAKILIKKAECYTRAVELIQKWSDKNKEIARPFRKLGAINNPLLAITMFAIAQHGANPDFFKVHGSNTGLRGTLEIFPAKSKVDESSITQSIKIADSENAAGFNVSYEMKLNKVLYSTLISFRFSQSTFRVEVSELEVGH